MSILEEKTSNFEKNTRKIEADINKAEDKKTLLEELNNVVGLEPPPLENPQDNTTVNQVENKGQQEEAQETQPEPKAKKAETKASVDIAKAFKRDFKIFGTIRDESHKDGLSFVSLGRQIDTGIESGNKETEIIEAVIRAVSPSLKLRSHLEIMSELSLSPLKQILRAHCKEKSATEIYKELAQFVPRSQRICPRFPDSSYEFTPTSHILITNSRYVKYEPSLVQSLFIHVVETGLQQESIRAKLRHLLEKLSVNDEELMDRVNLAVSVETERQNKM
ncbi:Hypothetical predicted protein [Paramuricea clavata]|uniref:Uncharacterized protein n=1 Tax=Paramuricea clavata TaxID=317549 RepID=A0A6S7GKW2_PARCT|nr:Hypothetical predicted protein [Paramuricea clavata]